MTTLPEVLQAVTLGPDDRLLLVLPLEAEADQMRETVELAAERLGHGRVLVGRGFEDVIVLHATKSEGSTVGQCGDRVPDLFGVNGFERVQSCHLAHGHTGTHSDGTAIWSAS